MAGKFVANEIVLGDSPTAANNFLLKTNANGTAGLYRNADGSGGAILTADASGNVVNKQMDVIAPTFNVSNGWVNYGGGDQTAGYWKDSCGVVHLQGLITTGIIGTVAFTLPVGYRPSKTEHFGTASDGLFGNCYITSAGDTVIAGGSNVWFALDGISFRAA